MAAPTFHGIVTDPADTPGSLTEPQTNLTLTPVASMQAGDLCIIRWYNENGSAGDGLGFGSGDGGQTWTTDNTSGSYSYSGTAAGHKIAWCTFNGSWGTLNWNAPSKSGTRGCGVQMIVFRPDSTSKVWQLDTSASWNGFSAPSGPPYDVTVTGITPSHSDSVTLVGICSDDDNSYSFSGSGFSTTGLGAQYRNQGGSDLATSYAYALQGSATATGNATFTQSALGPDAGSTFIIAFYATTNTAPTALSTSGAGTGTAASKSTAASTFSSTGAATATATGSARATSTLSGTGASTATAEGAAPVNTYETAGLSAAGSATATASGAALGTSTLSSAGAATGTAVAVDATRTVYEDGFRVTEDDNQRITEDSLNNRITERFIVVAADGASTAIAASKSISSSDLSASGQATAILGTSSRSAVRLTSTGQGVGTAEGALLSPSNAYSERSDNDRYWSSTIILLHLDGADTSTTITDATGNNTSISCVGSAQIDTAQSQFGGASLLLDGTGDYLTMSDPPNSQFTGDFTVEMWIRFNSLGPGNGGYPGGQWPAGATNYQWACWFGSTSIDFYWSTTGAYGGAIQFAPVDTVTTGAWYHLAFTRSGTTFRTFLNGKVCGQATLSGALYNSTGPLIVGTNPASLGGANQGINGWIDDFRITNGVARYTASFPVPTRAFPSTATVTVDGSVISSANLSAAASSTGTLAGKSNAASNLTATGQGTGTAESKSTASSDLSSTGQATGTLEGFEYSASSYATTDLSTTGQSTGILEGKSTSESVLSSTGQAAATAETFSITASTLSATGAATAIIAGSSVSAVTLSSIGTATATADSKSTSESTLSSTGAATATGTGRSTATADLSSTGQATATLQGTTTANSTADLDSTGQATAVVASSSRAASTLSSTGQATGTAATDSVSTAVLSSVGQSTGTLAIRSDSFTSLSASGASTATLEGSQIAGAETALSADGTSVAIVASATIASSAMSSVGSSSAEAEIEDSSSGADTSYLTWGARAAQRASDIQRDEQEIIELIAAILPKIRLKNSKGVKHDITDI